MTYKEKYSALINSDLKRPAEVALFETLDKEYNKVLFKEYCSRSVKELARELISRDEDRWAVTIQEKINYLSYMSGEDEDD